MKKLLCTAAVLAALTTTAQAQEMMKPYVGIDLQRTLYSYNDNYSLGGGAFLNGNTILNDGLNGANIHVGNRFTKNFGAEFGGFYNREGSKSIANGTVVGAGPTVAGGDFTTDVKTYGLTLDGLAYAASGHGGNKKLEKLFEKDPGYHRHFQFSVLQTLPSNFSKRESVEIEVLYKKKLGSRIHGLNLN